MNILRARKLRYGDRVKTPADMGIPAHTAIIRDTQCPTAAEYRTINGARYIWVQTNSGVWPSNRLEEL